MDMTAGTWTRVALSLAKDALMITGFVFVMMLVIEYLNVLTRGNWDRKLRGRSWRQSVLGALLGVAPGCLGSFAAVSLYAHRVITFGALVATMIATSGDEAFVMLALFPGKALLLFAILFVIGTATGVLMDVFFGSRMTRPTIYLADHQAVHEDEVCCIRFATREILGQWKRCSAHRGILSFFLVLFAVGIMSGELSHSHLGVVADDPGAADVAPEHGEEHRRATGHAGHAEESPEWNWVRITMLITGLVGLFIVATVPDHFLDSHLWDHIARVHIWRIFLWTVGALLCVHLVMNQLNLESWIRGSPAMVLLVACLVGIIPQSGPHLVFVTLYAQGATPFSVLLASSIVQDGHGMLPTLAHSRRAFLAVKAVKFAVGVAVGLAGLALGW